jgi:hypothetical protein
VLKPSVADFRQACGRRRWKERAWPMIAAIAQQGLALLPYHRANMIDLNQILAGMAAAIQSSDFPDASEMAVSLGLDLSTATVTVTRSGAIAIIGARFPALPTAEVKWRALRGLARRWIWPFSIRPFPSAPTSKRRRGASNALSGRNTERVLPSCSPSTDLIAE